MLVDQALLGRTDMVTGAERGRLPPARRRRRAGHPGTRRRGWRTCARSRPAKGCPRCDGQPGAVQGAGARAHLQARHPVLGRRWEANVLTADGAAAPIFMGSYGIGIGRVMAAAIELHHDDDGIIWPWSIAPYQAHVLTLGGERGAGGACRGGRRDPGGGRPGRALRRPRRPGWREVQGRRPARDAAAAGGRAARAWPTAPSSGSCELAARWSWCRSQTCRSASAP